MITDLDPNKWDLVLHPEHYGWKKVHRAERCHETGEFIFFLENKGEYLELLCDENGNNLSVLRYLRFWSTKIYESQE